MEAKSELQLNAINKARRREKQNFQQALDIQWINNRMEDGRMGRNLALIQKEAAMEKKFQERTDHAAIVNARAEKETALATEMAKVRREETCVLLRRHYLRERDPGLRELVNKMHAGYVCRDVRLQIQNNEYKRLQDMAEERRTNAVILNALCDEQEVREREDREKMELTTAYCREIQQQMINRERERQCKYEDTLVEKKMLEDIMRTLADEEQRALAEKQETSKRLRDEMVAFQQARVAWKEKQKQMIITEEKEIERQKAAVADRTSGIIAERDRKNRLKEELNEKVVAKILADEAVRQEREDVIKLLQEQEFLEQNANSDIAEKDKKERAKREIKEALTSQMEHRKKLEREQKERDTELRIAAEAQMAEEKQKDLQKEIDEKQKRRQYKQDLLAQMNANAIKKEKDRLLEEARVQDVWDCQNAWLSEVSHERREIVREHGAALLGHLQAGVLKPRDLCAVREGALTPDLARLHIESLAAPPQRRPQRFSKCNAQCRILREY